MSNTNVTVTIEGLEKTHTIDINGLTRLTAAAAIENGVMILTHRFLYSKGRVASDTECLNIANQNSDNIFYYSGKLVAQNNQPEKPLDLWFSITDLKGDLFTISVNVSLPSEK